MRINPYTDQGGLPLASASPGVGKSDVFEDLLKGALGEVNGLQLNAEKLIEATAKGEEIPPAVLNTAVVKADIAFRTMIQIRNKLVEAFQELRRLQV